MTEHSIWWWAEFCFSAGRPNGHPDIWFDPNEEPFATSRKSAQVTELGDTDTDGRSIWLIEYPNVGRGIRAEIRMSHLTARMLYPQIDSVDAPVECGVCWGTGLRGGFQGPCPNGCKVTA